MGQHRVDTSTTTFAMGDLASALCDAPTCSRAQSRIMTTPIRTQSPSRSSSPSPPESPVPAARAQGGAPRALPSTPQSEALRPLATTATHPAELRPRLSLLALTPSHQGAQAATLTAHSAAAASALPATSATASPPSGSASSLASPAALSTLHSLAQQLAELVELRAALLASAQTTSAVPNPTTPKARSQDKGKGKELARQSSMRDAEASSPDAPNVALLASRLDNALALYQRLSVERARALGQLEGAERRLTNHTQTLQATQQELDQHLHAHDVPPGTTATPASSSSAADPAQAPPTPQVPQADPFDTSLQAVRLRLESLTAAESVATQTLNKQRKELRTLEGDLRYSRRELESHTQLSNLPEIASSVGDFQVIQVLRREALPDRSFMGERVHEADFELFLRHFAEPMPTEPADTPSTSAPEVQAEPSPSTRPARTRAAPSRATPGTTAPPLAPMAGAWRIKPQFLDDNQADRHPLIAIISALSQVATPNLPHATSLLTNLALLPPGTPRALLIDPLGQIAQLPDAGRRQAQLVRHLNQRLDALLAQERRVDAEDVASLQASSHRRVRVTRRLRVNQTQLRQATQRWNFLCTLIERHRDVFIQDVARSLSPLIEAKNSHLEMLRSACEHLEASLSGIQARIPQMLTNAVERRTHLNAARNEYKTLVRIRQQAQPSTEFASTSSPATPRPEEGSSTRSPSGAPQAATASHPSFSSGRVPTRSDTMFRLESKLTQIQGRIANQNALVQESRNAFDSAHQALASAEESVRIAEAQLEQGLALQTQHSGSTRRARRQRQGEAEQMRHQAATLDAQIRAARTELMDAPTLGTLITPTALARAIERHVEPNHQALRERATQVGRATAYASEAHLVMALVDVHRHLREQPQRHSDGATDQILEHEQHLAHGFSDAPDQTDHPAPVRHSSFSLGWQASPGQPARLQVTHLFPYLPPRQLRSLDSHRQS